MNDTDTKNLYAALVKAQTAARAVGKNSTNKHHNYQYAAMEDLIAEGGRALSSAGLALFALGWGFVPPGVEGSHARVRIQYRLVHTSGESFNFAPVDVPSIPGNGRPEDKAEAAARTFALGYFLRDLLLIPRVDEQVDTRDDSQYQPPPPPKPGPAKVPASEPPPSPARESIAVVDAVEAAMRAAKTDPELVDASKPAKRAYEDKKISKAQYDALVAVFIECRKAIATAASEKAA
ncbi:ERF family protein [Pendulispora albinea]|uniref:ERF family protein n=1 Tax=Pendulispora albinea TaxID=2741071 RepID=A0ABZ2LZV4_9BACT